LALTGTDAVFYAQEANKMIELELKQRQRRGK
jgi:hypothetical protein